jgi:hypothetical protein
MLNFFCKQKRRDSCTVTYMTDSETDEHVDGRHFC